MIEEKEYSVIKGSLKSLADLSVRVATGKQVMSEPELVDQRLKVCDACPKLLFDRQCKTCICFVDVKVRLVGEACPEGKW